MEPVFKSLLINPWAKQWVIALIAGGGPIFDRKKPFIKKNIHNSTKSNDFFKRKQVSERLLNFLSIISLKNFLAFIDVVSYGAF